MKKLIKKMSEYKMKIIKHFSAVVFFVIVSLVFFFPVLEGKKILQNDIIQYSGMSKELKDFRIENGNETYWVNNAFSGMPTYQLGAKYPHNYIKELDLFVRFLPRPADYLFLYLLGFYFLMLSLKVDYRLAILGSLCFSLSTYLIVIIGAGHNAKAHAIAYMPFVLASIVYVTRRKYLIGFFLTTIFLGLQFTANHFQMTYYLMFVVIAMAVWFVNKCVKNHDRTHLIKSVITLLSALIFALLLNASNLLATIEYSNESTRGNASSLSIRPDGSVFEKESDGLNKEYITQWSYGVFESLNLFIPKIMGGGSSEELSKDSEFYGFLRQNGYNSIESLQIVKNSPTYWGNQPFVEAPAYIGITVFFLFVFSIFLYRGQHKGWILAAIIASLLLSYGKNLEFLTNFLIEHFPLYNKFRAVASIQVILELCVPILSILGLSTMFSNKIALKEKFKALNSTLLLFVITISVLYLFRGFLSFSGISDTYMDEGLVDVLIDDRKNMYINQLIRTLFFVSVIYLLMFLYLNSKFKRGLLIFFLGLLISFDLISFSKNYVNEDNFTKASLVDNPYQSEDIYEDILKDKSDFRVLDLTDNSTKTNYFFNSLKGYHAAKLGRYNDILEFYVNKTNMKSLDMLNTKYIIYNDEDVKNVYVNDDISGSAWFVNENFNVKSDNDEILSLDSLNFRNFSVSQDFVTKKYKNSNYKVDLIEKKSNYLKYMVETDAPGLIIFSEIYYPHGWNSYINGEIVSHFRFNYILRGLEVPNGKHQVEFKFEPEVVELGGKISLFSTISFILIMMFMTINRKNWIKRF